MQRFNWFHTVSKHRKISVKVIIFFLLTIAVFYINAFHEQYPDEYDNLLGGWYILHGILPFSGFFSHHGPVAYYVSALVQVISGHSFVHFRVVYNLLLACGIFAWYFYLRSRFGPAITSFYLYFSLLIGIAATYFWGQMLLADTLSGYLLGCVFIFFVLKYIYNEKIILKDVIILSLLLFLALLSALTYIYLCAVVYVYILVAYYRDYQGKHQAIEIIKVVGSLVVPYLLFLLYLVITRSLSDYIYQSIVFNQKYYIYNYPNLVNGHINPIRFAIVIAYNFISNFYTLLLQAGSFNFRFPFNITLALVDVVMLIYVLLRRNYSLFIFILLFMVFANARSNALNSKETDYQSSVYIIMSLLSMAFILPNIVNELSLHIPFGRKVILTALFLVTSVYCFFTIALLTDSFLGKAYGKFMGFAPLIYDRPDAAVTMNNAVNTNTDYIWIGPLDFQDYYYMNGQLASKYHILIPGMGKSDKIQQEFLADITTHMPKLVFLDKHYNVLGSSPVNYAQYCLQFLDVNYTSLSQYRQNGVQYTSTIKSDKYDLDTDMLIRRKDVSATIAVLLNNNLIKPLYATH